MNSFIAAATVFLVCAQGWIAANAAQCPHYCKQEVGRGNKVLCDCCHRFPGVPPITSPCAGASCTNGHCVDVECKDCTNGVSIRCQPSCGDREPSSCTRGQLLVRNGANCKFCRTVGRDIIDPCAKSGACKQGEECVRRDVQCFRAPCHPVKECHKKCPPINCPWGCYQYEKKDGCGACKCCQYEL